MDIITAQRTLERNLINPLIKFVAWKLIESSRQV